MTGGVVYVLIGRARMTRRYLLFSFFFFLFLYVLLDFSRLLKRLNCKQLSELYQTEYTIPWLAYLALRFTIYTHTQIHWAQ